MARKAATTARKSKTAPKKAATKKVAAKKAPTKKAAKKVARKSARREAIAPRGDKRYVRRDEQGQFRESDDQGESLGTDVKQKAKTKVKPGQGDKGDQK